MALTLLWSGCGEVKGTNNPDSGSNVDPNADFTLTVDPTTTSIPIGGSAKVTVTVERDGNVGDVTLTVTGLGANLTVDFDPVVIAAGETTSEITINALGGMAAGTSTVTIVGNAGTKEHSATVSVTTTTITVSGTVRGARAGVRVGIIGKGSQMSGAGGVFTFPDVTPPYDLYTLADDGCNTATPTVFFFDDLTRPDPVVSAGVFNPTCGSLTILCGVVQPCPSSAFDGTRTGSGNNTDDVIFAWSEGSANGTLASNGTYTGSASWRSGASSQGNLHALQLTRKANGAPNTFLGYQRSALVTLNNGGSQTINLNFVPVGTTATITGTLNGPGGAFPTPTVYLWQQFGSSQRTLWQTETTAIDAAFPIIANAGGNNLFAQSTVSGVGSSAFVQPLSATATINFTMPAPATLNAPENGATGVTTATTFSFTPSTGVISEISISTTTPTRARFRIFTTKSETSIPVIPELALPSGQSFSWVVLGYAPTTGINDAAAANELETVSSGDFAGPAHALSSTVARSFTTP